MNTKVMNKTSPSSSTKRVETVTDPAAIYDVADTPTADGEFRVIARHDPNSHLRSYCLHTTWIAAWRCAKLGECTKKGNGKGQQQQ